MGKKLSKKELREQQKAAKAQSYREKDRALEEERRLEEEKRQAHAKRRENFEKERIKREDKASSTAKAAGLKSIFSVEDSLIMTSFGNGNDAVIEKTVKDGKIADIAQNPAFSVEKIPKKFEIHGRTKGIADNPSESSKKIGMDIIHCKDALEKEFFSTVFDDNIHIQLIYNILDIEKILAVHINNIVYAIDNIARSSDAEYDDYLGYMSLRNTYDQYCHPEKYYTDSKILGNIAKSKAFFDELINNPRLGYFGSAFYETGTDKKAKKGKTKRKSEEEIYYILGALGNARQMLAHSKKNSKAFIYNLEKNCNSDALYVLDKTYSERVKSLNGSFMEHSRKDITIILDALGINSKQQKKKTVADFYNFTVKKTYKNLGFSFKKLRECILKLEDASVMKSDKYNTVRSKMYKIFS